MTDIPYGNLTALNDEIVHGWEGSARNRGTADLLYSCLVTITLCIFTAIHLNIPSPHERSRAKYLRLAKWVLIGIFAPEWVVFTAWLQWRDARALLKYIKEHVNSMEEDLTNVVATTTTEEAQSRYNNEESQPLKATPTVRLGKQPPVLQTDKSSRHHIANIRYAFYAIMGGFRVDVSDISEDLDSIVLSKTAIMELIETGGYRYLKLDNQLIEGRSKANNLAKLLVCSQVAWMATQCIARKASGLPLALLELHTFAHVLCALCIYIFWFGKPLGVDEATTITLPNKFRAKIAYAVALHEKQAIAVDLKRLGQEDWAEAYQTLHIEECTISESRARFPSGTHDSKYVTVGELDTCKSNCKEILHIDENAHEFAIYYDAEHATDDIQLRVVFPDLTSSCVLVKMALNDKTKLRWQLIQSADLKVPRSEAREFQQTYPKNRETTYPIGDNINEHGNWNSDIYSAAVDPIFKASGNESSSLLKPLVVMLVTCSYGAIHLGAWDWGFPSPTEQLLWRISSVFLMGLIPLIIIIPLLNFYVFFFLSWIVRSPFVCMPIPWFRWAKSWIEFTSKSNLAAALLFSGLVAICGGAACILARIYLVVEVFVSLRAVPVGVYATIPWTQYIPHL